MTKIFIMSQTLRNHLERCRVCEHPKNKKSIVFLIEHLESELGKWCMMEYVHMSEEVGKKNIWFTNVPRKDTKKLEKVGNVFDKSVRNLALNMKRVCVLDPDASETLTPEDAGKFDYFVFGGILGDNPPRKRTGPELTQFMKGAGVRNIGKEQMSTDNAVFTVKKIIVEGKKFEDLKFQDEVEIEKNDVESFILPYRYNLVNGKPYMSEKLVEFLKKKKDF